jgi:hypothetical protein
MRHVLALLLFVGVALVNGSAAAPEAAVVKHGENQGRTLTHAAVVRDMRTVAEASGPSPSADARIKIAPEWIRAHLKVVAFVQERASRRVLATSAMAVPHWQ